MGEYIDPSTPNPHILLNWPSVLGFYVVNAIMPETASYVCHVFHANGMTVVAGVNVGDKIMNIDEVCLGDVYELSSDCEAFQLFIADRVENNGEAGRFLGQSAGRASVAKGSDAGEEGDAISLEGRLTFMTPDGEKAEILLISILPCKAASCLFFLPLSPLEPGLEYTLIAATSDPGDVTLADVISVAFTRGTLITLANGTQRAIEDIRPGDLVLTRGAGPQPVRHVIQRTLRAVGAFAPVAIPKGTLGNANDLIISQHQRLFLYQRGPDRIVETSEMLVRARDLVDGDVVVIRKGGFTDYVSLVFDQHEVIFAECIPAESLLVNESTRRALPKEERASLSSLSQAPLHATEAPSAAFAKARDAILRKN